MEKKTDVKFAATKSTGKKAGKADIGSIMDDAPLFAGLDDYILKHTARMKAEPTKAGRIREKKKAETAQTKQTASGGALHQSPSKVQKIPATEPITLLLSVAEMCALLKISRATLVRMDKSGQLPGRIKLGGSVRFHRKTVETWLQSLITIHPTLS